MLRVKAKNDKKRVRLMSDVMKTVNLVKDVGSVSIYNRPTSLGLSNSKDRIFQAYKHSFTNYDDLVRKEVFQAYQDNRIDFEESNARLIDVYSQFMKLVPSEEWNDIVVKACMNSKIKLEKYKVA
jgi:hypothetical protein